MTRHYYVPQDRTLFIVTGCRMRETFNELRKKTRRVLFKPITTAWAEHLRNHGHCERVLEMKS